MTPMIRIRKRDRSDGWLTMDLQEVEEIGLVIVIPLFGPDHNCGMDCWCGPADADGVVVHNVAH